MRYNEKRTGNRRQSAQSLRSCTAHYRSPAPWSESRKCADSLGSSSFRRAGSGALPCACRRIFVNAARDEQHILRARKGEGASNIRTLSAARRIVLQALSAALLATLIIALLPAALADVVVLTADSTTASATPGVTNPNSATGNFDGTVAYSTSAYSASNQWTNLTIQNASFNGTIQSVKFTIRLNASPASSWNDDSIDIQYTNDTTAATWYNALTGQRPLDALTYYGNYTVTATFPSIPALNTMMVRLRYVRSSGADGIRTGVDAVEVYVTYAPPPNVTLFLPGNDSWQTSPNISFSFTPFSQTTFVNCSIYLNGTYNRSNQSPVVANANNTINVTGLVDGDYSWNITCRDVGNYNGSARSSFILHIDTVPPNVSLYTPGNNTIRTTSFNSFNFSVNDNASIASCSLYVDGSFKDSTTNVPKGTPTLLNATLTQGDHLWYVNCTDSNGWTGKSYVFNVSVQPITPTLVQNASDYVIGGYVLYNGTNWQVGATVRVNVTLANGSVESYDSPVAANNKINATHWLSYYHPNGTYTAYAWQLNDTTLNASASYEVHARLVNVTPDTSAYAQGDSVVITGLGYHPLSTVNLSITYNGNRNETIIGANASGGFTYTHTLALNEPIGQHNITATDRNYSILVANSSFTVNNRTPTLTTNRSSYGENESVGILGRYFTLFGTIQLLLYSTVTGRYAPNYPVNFTANSSGNFNSTWNVTNTCSGNYTLQADDQNTTSYHANTTFLINNSLNNNLTRVVDAVSANRVTTALANVTSSNDVWQVTGLSGSVTDGYLQFNFTPSIPANATFSRVNITVEHHDSGSKITGYQMYWVSDSGLVTLVGSGCSGSVGGTDANVTCDITSRITNSTLANNLSIRVNYTRSGGGTSDALVDIAVVRYQWTGDPYGCVNFGDTPEAPTIDSISVPGSPVVLNAGSTRDISCNVTVRDNNGADQITGANASFYIVPSTSGSALSNVSKYLNASCTVTSSTAVTKSFTCGVALLYYASNGTWTCNATGISTDGTASRNVSFIVDPLYAINVTSTNISFGDLGAGDISPNVSINTTNVGNQRINVSIYGYGRVPGDNVGFTCPVTNVSVNYIRFSTLIAAAYNQKTNLSSAPQWLNYSTPSQNGPAIIMQNASYWQASIPLGFAPQGLCNGTVVFQAEAP